MQLLPCPFCGTKNPLFNIEASAADVIKPGWYIRCRRDKCAARITSGTAPSVMKKWNTRPAPTDSPLKTEH